MPCYLPQDNYIPSAFSVKKAIKLSVHKEKIPEFYTDKMICTMLDKKIAHL
ncbi:hypothetical protein CLU83_3828 [Flavobacterium sp. 1]|nr:hypothetical protein CLU83_3828 [Flavobacterium sp. 1]